MIERPRARCVANPQEARCDGIESWCVEFVEVAVVIDENGSLKGFFGEGIVADTVMSEVIKDLESEEKAGRRIVSGPVEDGAIDDLHMVSVAARGSRAAELRGLQRGERGGDFDDFKLGPFVYVRVHVPDVVEDIKHQCAVAGAHFVDYEVVVGVVRIFIVFDEVAGDSFAVVGAEEFGGCVPELTGVVGLFGVERVFKGGVALS